MVPVRFKQPDEQQEDSRTTADPADSVVGSGRRCLTELFAVMLNVFQKLEDTSVCR